MKRVLSLILVLSLVLGMFPATFAEETAATMTAGETLKSYGLLEGDDTGDLNEAGAITRAEMMVVLSRLLKVEDDAKAFGLGSDFADVEGHWAKNYIDYAKLQKWTEGTSATTFAPDAALTEQETATFILRALGYTGETVYATAIETAKEMGIEVAAVDSAKMIRGEVFDMAKDALAVKIKDTEGTLGAKLEIVDFTTPVVETPDAKFTAAKAVDDKKIELTFDAAVTTATVTVMDADKKAVEVKEVVDGAEKTIFATFETALTVGAKYDVTVGDVTVEVVGTVDDDTKPAVSSAISMGNTRVKVTFADEDSLRADILNADNYSVNKDLVVTGVEYNLDSDDDEILTEVILTTAAQTSGTIYTLTVSDIMDKAGNKVDSSKTKNFSGQKVDATKPVIYSAIAKNGSEVEVQFTENSYMNAETLANLDNYTVADLELVSVEVNENKLNAKKKVTLTTATQVKGKIYTLKVNNVADEFGNEVKSDSSKTFAGTTVRTTKLEVSSAISQTNTKVKVTFSYVVDEALAADITNYEIDKDLEVIAAKVVKVGDDKKAVELTTSKQTKGTIYKVTVSNVTDKFGNALNSSKDNKTFSGRAEDTTLPKVSTLTSTAKDMVEIVFDGAVNEAIAETLSNYHIKDLGYPTKAVLQSDDVTVKLTTAKQKVGTIYTMTVKNIEDEAGNVIKEVEKTFAGTGTAGSKITIDSIVAVDEQTIKITLDQDISITGDDFGAAVTVKKDVDTTITNDLATASAGQTAYTLVDADYTAIVDADDKNILHVRFPTKKLEGGHIYTFEFPAASLTDANGAAKTIDVADDANVITVGTLSDEVAELKIISVLPVEGSTGLDYIAKFNADIKGTGSLVNTGFTVEYTKADGTDVVLTTSALTAEGSDSVRFTVSAAIEKFSVAEVKIVASGAGNEVADITDMFLDNTAVVTDSDYEVVFSSGDNEAGEFALETVVGEEANHMILIFNEELSTAAAGQVETGKAGIIIEEDGTDKVVTINSTYQDADDKEKIHVFMTEGTKLSEGIAYTVRLTGAALVSNATLKGSASGTMITTSDDRDEASFGYVSTENAKPTIAGVVALTDYKIEVTFSEELAKLVAAAAIIGDLNVLDADGTVIASGLTETKVDNKKITIEIDDTKGSFVSANKYSVNIKTSLMGRDAVVGSDTGADDTGVEFTGIATITALDLTKLHVNPDTNNDGTYTDPQVFAASGTFGDVLNEKISVLEMYNHATINPNTTQPGAASYTIDLTGAKTFTAGAQTTDATGATAIAAGDKIWYRVTDLAGNTTDWVQDGAILAASGTVTVTDSTTADTIDYTFTAVSGASSYTMYTMDHATQANVDSVAKVVAGGAMTSVTATTGTFGVTDTNWGNAVVYPVDAGGNIGIGALGSEVKEI